jgi:ABC-type transport system substrate-binding protein
MKAKASESSKTNNGTGGPVDASVIDNSVTLKFSLSAKEDTWIAVDLDGIAQPSILLTKGQDKTYTVKKSLNFRVIGNAAGVNVDVNGLSLKAFGKEGQVIRGLVIDRKTVEQYLAPEQTPAPPSAPPAPKVTPAPQPTTAVTPPAEITQPPVSGQDELKKVRVNSKGERLILRLVTAQEPATFLKVAEIIQKQWLEAGAKVVIETYSLPDLQDKIRKRDYDILLFGQNLGYNLDAFPFWHSSQAKNGLNLSNYHSLEADNLLVDIRKTFDERTKQVYLDKLKKVIADDTPAIFLYNPNHYYMVDTSVKNVDLGKLSSHEDRFSDVVDWYVREDYKLKEPVTIGGLFKWIFSW